MKGSTTSISDPVVTDRRTVALGYVRRSKESGARTISLDDQRARVADYCRAQGWKLAEVLADDGVSGGRRERLERLAERVKVTGARVIVVYHLDRFARDLAATLDYLRRFSRRGVELHVVGRGRVEADTATGFIVTAAEGLAAEHYRRVISEKTRDALARLRDRGRRFSGMPPTGLDSVLGDAWCPTTGARHPRPDPPAPGLRALPARRLPDARGAGDPTVNPPRQAPSVYARQSIPSDAGLLLLRDEAGNFTQRHTGDPEAVRRLATLLRTHFDALLRTGGTEAVSLSSDEPRLVVLAGLIPGTGESRGVLCLGRSAERGTFVPWEHELVLRYAHTIALAWRQTAADASPESDALETTSFLATLLESKDPALKGHSARVSLYAGEAAAAMGLPPAVVAVSRRAGLLQDLGKLALLDAILLKPGTLTPEEYGLVRRHPVIGGRILERLRFLGAEAEAVACHLERYDGTGFPGSLRGEAIPLAARLVAVADAFDAVTSPRPYRSARSLDAALGEIRRGAGAQFDPAVVAAFTAFGRRRGGHAAGRPERDRDRRDRIGRRPRDAGFLPGGSGRARRGRGHAARVAASGHHDRRGRLTACGAGAPTHPGTLLSAVLGYPLAYFLVRTRSRLKPVYTLMVFFPLLVSVVIRSYGWLAILGEQGLLNSLWTRLPYVAGPLPLLFREYSVVVGLVQVLLPFMVIPLASAIQNIDPAQEEAATSLGASAFQLFRAIILPLSTPGLISGSLLVFTGGMSAFAIPMFLGGPRQALMAVLIYQQMVFTFNWPIGSALAILMLLTTLAAIALSLVAARGLVPRGLRT